MKIEDFKLIKNTQRPEICFCYVRYNGNKSRKFSMFTMNGGKTYLSSIEEKGFDGLYYTVFEKTVPSLSEALEAINKYLS